MTANLKLVALAATVVALSTLTAGAAPVSPSIGAVTEPSATAGSMAEPATWRRSVRRCHIERVVDWRWGRRVVRLGPGLPSEPPLVTLCGKAASLPSTGRPGTALSAGNRFSRSPRRAPTP